MTKQEEWLQALESGYYQQGQGKLCDNERYCCLGVAMRVNDIPIARSQRFPWTSQIIQLGLKENGARHLAALNDRGVTFKSIAGVIRQNPEEYFL